jgi:DNA-binding SARP family transcriptional activator
VQLSLIEGFELRREETVVHVAPSAQRLLAFVATHQRPLQRVYIAGRIWTNFSQEHANANLRTALWRLPRPGGPLVESRPGGLALAPGVAVDMHELLARASRVLERRPHPEDLARLADAGELLPDWYDDWLYFERERFRQLRLLALEELCGGLIEAGEFARALQAGLAAVAGEPLRETAHRALIKAHLAQGNAAEALRQYCMFRALMRDQLGLEPSNEMRQLVAPLELAT